MLTLIKESFGRMPMQHLARLINSQFLITLMYHDVCPDNDLDNWLRVPASQFEAQLKAIRSLGTILNPKVLAQPGLIPRGGISFLITFDDGYHYNANIALPILERLSVPAIFFVSTGPYLTRELFWNDLVVTPIQAEGLSRIDLSQFGLGQYFFRPGPPNRRWDDIQRLLEEIKGREAMDGLVVDKLTLWFRDRFSSVIDKFACRYAPLTIEELTKIACSPYGFIGSHGHDHRIMTRLSDQQLHESLSLSRDVLEKVTGKSIYHFAYPNGDYDGRVLAAVKDAGYQRAFTVTRGAIIGEVDSLRLPRLSVGAFDSPAILRYKVFRLLAKHLSGRVGRLDKVIKFY